MGASEIFLILLVNTLGNPSHTYKTCAHILGEQVYIATPICTLDRRKRKTGKELISHHSSC